MNTQKSLNNLVKEIGQLTGQATSREEAQTTGKEKFLFLEYASCYGGYRLVNVGVSNGAHYGAFGGNGCEGRLSASKMATKLEGILSGIEAVKIN